MLITKTSQNHLPYISLHFITKKEKDDDVVIKNAQRDQKNIKRGKAQ